MCVDTTRSPASDSWPMAGKVASSPCVVHVQFACSAPAAVSDDERPWIVIVVLHIPWKLVLSVVKVTLSWLESQGNGDDCQIP